MFDRRKIIQNLDEACTASGFSAYIDEYDVWPYLRTKLYFYYQLEKKHKKTSFLKKKLYQYYSLYLHINKYEVINQGSTELLFSYQNREIYQKNKIMHKFFTPVEFFSQKKYSKIHIKNYSSKHKVRKFFALFQSATIQIRNLSLLIQECSKRLGIIDKSVIENSLMTIAHLSKNFRYFLKKLKIKVIHFDCWYSTESIAALIAAKKLQIKTTDIQHGVQDKDHPGYSLSTLSHSNIFPNEFYIWGPQSSYLLIEAPTEINVNFLPNLWYYYYQQNISVQKQNFKESKPTVLFSLQDDFSCYSKIFNFISTKQGGKFNWILKTHPSVGIIDSMKIFLESPKSNVYISDAQSSILSLLSTTSLHITAYSTCAIEALGYGVPSIIIDQNGYKLFKELIEQKVMLYLKEEEELSENLISDTMALSGKNCIKVAETLLGRECNIENATKQLTH